MKRRYEGQVAAFLTQHGKEALIAPILEPILGCQVKRIEGYDTDQLGTFSGEIKRLENQIETARTKARIGIEISGMSTSLASEGAFISDPYSGLVPWNVEVVLWLDTKSQFEVIGIAQGPTLSLQQTVRTVEELEIFAKHAAFPSHHLVLRPESESDRRIDKGISSWEKLKQSFIECQSQSTNGAVFVEHDHRAFSHPTRQEMIKNAAKDLLKKFQSTCPQCEAPGFALTGHTSGLPCKSCGSKTKSPISYTLSCRVCHFSEEKSSDERFSDPSRCDVCNP